MRRALPILVGLIILAAACGGVDNGGGGRGAVSTAPATVESELLGQFDYDASARLDVKELKSEVKDGAVVHDITYAGPEGRIDAFLITPQGDGPYPAVEFMPGAPGAKYADRCCHPAIIHAGDEVVRAFASVGWGWGGYWSGGTKDYQHFSTTGG